MKTEVKLPNTCIIEVTGESGKLDAGGWGQVSEAKYLGEGRVRAFQFYELAHI